MWVGVFGLVAAVASWRSGWKATALPASTAQNTLLSNPDTLSEKAPDNAVMDDDISRPLDIEGFST